MEHSNTPSKYLVESLLKRNLVNVVVGMSGAGKSKWVTQMIRAQLDGRQFLDTYPTQPTGPIHYAGLDRHQDEMAEFIENANLLNEPLFTWKSYRSRLRELNRLDKLIALVPPETEHLIIDGIGFLVDEIIKQRAIGVLFADLDNWIAKKGQATATLIHHTAKSKTGQGYAASREKGLGSGAWAQMAAVHVLIESVNPMDIADNRRTVSVSQNNLAGFSIAANINKDSGAIELDPDVREFTRADLREALGIEEDEERSLSRRIDQWLKEGLFERLQNGHFRGRFPTIF